MASVSRIRSDLMVEDRLGLNLPVEKAPHGGAFRRRGVGPLLTPRSTFQSGVTSEASRLYSGTFLTKEFARIFRSSAANPASGISRRITRKAKPHLRQRLY